MNLVVVFVALLFTGCAHDKAKWEYTIQSIDDGVFTSSMDTLGAHGWELVFARRASSGPAYDQKFQYEVILKREKPEEN